MRVPTGKHAYERPLSRKSNRFQPCDPLVVEPRRVDCEKSPVELGKTMRDQITSRVAVFRHNGTQLMIEPTRTSEAISTHGLLRHDPGAFRSTIAQRCQALA